MRTIRILSGLLNIRSTWLGPVSPAPHPPARTIILPLLGEGAGVRASVIHALFQPQQRLRSTSESKCRRRQAGRKLESTTALTPPLSPKERETKSAPFRTFNALFSVICFLNSCGYFNHSNGCVIAIFRFTSGSGGSAGSFFHSSRYLASLKAIPPNNSNGCRAGHPSHA
jgi:hypothetical protein